MGTWKATTVLRQIDCYDRAIPLVARSVDYLLSTRRSDGRWAATGPSTNGFPHAEWWEDTGPADQVWGVNPTAAVLGYLLQGGVDVADDVQELVRGYVEGGPVTMTELPCALTLHDDMKTAGLPIPEAFTGRLALDIDVMLERDPARWSDYVVRPSTLFNGEHADFAEAYADLIAEEKRYLLRTMNADGSWEPNWRWSGFPQEWAVAKNWWKAIQAKDYLAFLAE